jgi:RimJ/RimL family protein N-acetyltransferase
MKPQQEVNRFNQPLGQRIDHWQNAQLPKAISLQGQYCRLEPLNPDIHGQALYLANSTDDGSMWTYLPYGPFEQLSDYMAWLTQISAGSDPLFYVIISQATQQPLGLASFLRIDPANGVIEVGHLAYSPSLRHTVMATEAMYLMMQYAFDLGYRRYEWKCNALNHPSRHAALRLGFTFEGIFRQAMINKGRNRDTAWFSIIDSEWPALKQVMQQWLDPQNFNAEGQQLSALSVLTAQLRHSV